MTAAHTIRHLEEQEVNIRQILVPAMEKMRQSLATVQRSLAGKSAISLEVTKWQIQSVLRDLKLQIRQGFTEGFQIDSEMSRSIDKLEEAMMTLINIFDRLQSYQEEAKLASYIAEIASAQFMNVDIMHYDP